MDPSLFTQPTPEERCWNWHRYLVRVIHGEWARELVNHVPLAAAARVIDIACATGTVAREAAQKAGPGGEAIGFDLDATMLRVAAQIPAAPGSAPIRWIQGDVMAMPFAPGTFDAVFCQQGLQFFPDRVEALRRFRHILKSGGRIALSVLRPTEHNPGAQVFGDALGRQFGPEARKRFRMTFEVGEAPELHQFLASAGFLDTSVVPCPRTAVWASPEEFVAASLNGCTTVNVSLDMSKIEAIISDVRHGLAQFLKEGRLELPMSCYLVTART